MITQENIPYTADEIKAMVKTCEKYNKALERARQFSEHPLQEDSADIVEYIFPELVGSEDEKMRKMCMKYLDWEYQHCYSNEDKKRIEKCIVWLEQQGEQQPASVTDEWIEPKFKVGNWIVGDEGIFKITQYEDEYGYELTGTTGYVAHFVSPDYVESNYHLWTLQDAKDGDVLYCKAVSGTEFIMVLKNITRHDILNSYCRYNSAFGFSINVSSVMSVTDDPKPATKEQCDLLFHKMEEAGYEWDNEKKCLTKI